MRTNDLQSALGVTELGSLNHSSGSCPESPLAVTPMLLPQHLSGGYVVLGLTAAGAVQYNDLHSAGHRSQSGARLFDTLTAPRLFAPAA